MTLHILYKVSLVGVLGWLTSANCFSQSATRHYVDSALEKSDTTFKTRRNAFYVVNGIVYDSLQVDTALNKYDLKYLVDIRYLSSAKNGFHNDAVLIQFAFNQKRKAKRKSLKIARRLYRNTSGAPELVIGNYFIESSISELTLKALRPKDIMYIDTTQKENIQQIRIWKAN